jgi:ribosomal protein S18 acetylase RimI-like enzyme
MSQLTIRTFRSTDLDAVLAIARESFAEEMTAQSIRPDDFAQHMRQVARGRMIPFRVQSALAGITFEIVVAEQDGAVVGFGMYAGRQRMYLSTLMVLSAYRRQGIGQALLAKRLQRIRERGYSSATAMVLPTNHASLGNLRKQGFEVFAQTSRYERALPWTPAPANAVPNVVGRPVRRADQVAFALIEQAITRPIVLQVADSLSTNYFPSRSGQLFACVTRSPVWRRCYEHSGKAIGFLMAVGSTGPTPGLIARPIIRDEDSAALPLMLGEAAQWLTNAGKETVQMAVPDESAQLIALLQREGWTKGVSWTHVAKRFDVARQA